MLARGFWSALPFLDRELIADLLERGRSASSAEVVDAALASLEGEEFRARLGRIACGYDGGQIYPDDQDAASPIEGGSASKK